MCGYTKQTDGSPGRGTAWTHSHSLTHSLTRSQIACSSNSHSDLASQCPRGHFKVLRVVSHSGAIIPARGHPSCAHRDPRGVRLQMCTSACAAQWAISDLGASVPQASRSPLGPPSPPFLGASAALLASLRVLLRRPVHGIDNTLVEAGGATVWGMAAVVRRSVSIWTTLASLDIRRS